MEDGDELFAAVDSDALGGAEEVSLYGAHRHGASGNVQPRTRKPTCLAAASAAAVACHPDRVRAIVPIDAVSGYYVMPETAGPIAQAIFLTDIGQKIMQKVGAAQPKALLKSLFEAESYFSKEQIKAHSEWVIANSDVLAFVYAFMATMTPYKLRKPGTDNDMKIFAEYTHLPLEQVTVPTLVIHGTHDSDVKLYDGVYAHEHIAGSERFWIEEGSHLGFWISPNGREAQRIAREFLARHTG